MTERRDKRLMLDLLKYSGKVFYKDKSIVVIRPGSKESFVHFLTGANGFVHTNVGLPNLWTDEELYIVLATEERFLIKVNYEDWSNNNFQFIYSPEKMPHISVIDRYPSLKKAFTDIARKVNYLPLIENQNENDVHSALKKDYINIKYVDNLTQKRKLKLIKLFPRTFEHMEQNPELARYIIDHTDIGLGNISSDLCTAYICKQGVKKHPTDIQYVPNHHNTNELKLLAIKQNPRALNHITHPTFQMYVTAVRSGKNGWEYVPESLKKKVRKAL